MRLLYASVVSFNRVLGVLGMKLDRSREECRHAATLNYKLVCLVLVLVKGRSCKLQVVLAC